MYRTEQAMKNTLLFVLLVGSAACGRLDHVGKPPDFTPQETGRERVAMLTGGASFESADVHKASLWSGGQRSLLGDRRAIKRGDILTVVIEIDELRRPSQQLTYVAGSF